MGEIAYALGRRALSAFRNDTSGPSMRDLLQPVLEGRCVSLAIAVGCQRGRWQVRPVAAERMAQLCQLLASQARDAASAAAFDGSHEPGPDHSDQRSWIVAEMAGP